MNPTTSFFTTIKKGNNIITAPHASQKRYDSKYIGSSDRGTDIIAKQISKQLNFTLILPTYSRFIIDFNKPKNKAILKQHKSYTIPNITQQEKEKRLIQYNNYYKNLKEITKQNSLHISLHTMTPIGGKKTQDENITRPDIRLGTLNQTTIKKNKLNILIIELKKQNLTIEIDNFFLGGEEIKQTNKNKAHSIQIEINTKHILNQTTKKIDKKKINNISNILINSIKKFI